MLKSKNYVILSLAMNKFIIFYGGAASIEIINYMFDAKISSKDDIFYFFDKSMNKQNKKYFKDKIKNIKFLNRISELKKTNTKKCIISTGSINLRQKACSIIKKLKLKPIKVIHPKSYVSNDAIISEGVIIAPFVTVAPFSKIGKNSFLNSYSSLGHHSKLGEGNILCPYSTINGNSSVGKFNYFGTGSVVNSKIKIANSSKLSSNSVLRSNMGSFSLAHGNPAKTIKIYLNN